MEVEKLISDVTATKPRLISFQELISNLIKRGAKCDCGYIFKENDFHSYDHSYGVKLADFKSKQWVYATCPLCQYDFALWKIINSLDFQDGD